MPTVRCLKLLWLQALDLHFVLSALLKTRQSSRASRTHLISSTPSWISSRMLGSEHSFRSQKSFDHFSIRKTFQTQPSRQRMETSSNRSNSYHGNDFSNNSMYSRASQNKGTHSGSNESVSEIISDKVGSVGSWSSGKDSPMVGQPRSEGSERRAYPGRRALRQIGSLRVQSDDESF
ncbi:hypothetical protein GOODEAATRI_029084 [Goodea atripinnis]|uniref:Uncharacterized protein n=1 Tax=Goodea atripinnis TaxID=208336 RepID=A0ABV0MM32_9TELE